MQALGLGDADSAPTGTQGSRQEPELTLPTADKEAQHHPTHGAASLLTGRLDPQGAR